MTSADLPTGQLIEKVACANDATQSYALYLPSNYSPNRKWPVLYAFDPVARGKLPLERFKDAAEKYGWILVGSNNSRNGPMKVAIDAGQAIWKDTHERLAIDEQRRYFAGFSGGARVAVFLANACRDCVTGVLVCGAGFPAEIKPSAATRFQVFGAAGTDDFNFFEIKQLGETLTKAGVTNRTEIFSGRHEWLPSLLATEAVEWFTLQAIKLRTHAPDTSFVDQLWQRKIEQAKAAETAARLYEAYQFYAALAETFKGLRDVSEVEKRTGELLATREVKQAINSELKEIGKQQELNRQINDFIFQRERNPEDFETSSRLKALLSQLHKSAADEKDSSERRLARRLTESLFVVFSEQGRELQSEKRYDEAIRKLKLAAEILPDRAGVLVTLAAAYSLQGDKKKALQSLKTAIEKGYKDQAAIINNRAFDSIRNEALYLQLIEGLSLAK